MTRIWYLGFVFGLPGMIAGIASGSVVTFEYTGYVDIVDDPQSYLNGSIRLGTPFSATYSFDPATPPGIIDPPAVLYYGPLTSYTLDIGGYTVTGIGAYNRILVADTFDGWDEFRVVNQPRPFAGQWVTISQALFASNGKPLSSSNLPVMPPPLNSFETREFALYNASGSLGIHGVITSLTPEPSAVLLLAGGVWAVLGRSGRQGLRWEARR